MRAGHQLGGRFQAVASDCTSDPDRCAAPAAGELTRWLDALEQHDEAASRQLFEWLYDEVRRVARGHMRHERGDHTLSATALAHEAWFRMAGQGRTRWRNRGHFLAVAATLMRRILVNHEAARRADKREAEQVPLTLQMADMLGDAPTPDVLALHEALLAFEARDPRAARVVELRFFGGLEHEEIADTLGVSVPTVKRDWAFARAWLRRELQAA